MNHSLHKNHSLVLLRAEQIRRISYQEIVLPPQNGSITKYYFDDYLLLGICAENVSDLRNNKAQNFYHILLEFEMREQSVVKHRGPLLPHL